MILFDKIHSDVVPVLKEEKIKESALFNNYSDLYIGCKDFAQANRVLKAGIWKAMSSVFVPQKDSDMDIYPIAADIAFGPADYDFEKRFKNRK